ncbi:MAG: hypothetical protein JO180_11750, partial [Gemmatirosa sp.]|nr:hypothetical protein [Gemmatirosa sp.]
MTRPNDPADRDGAPPRISLPAVARALDAAGLLVETTGELPAEAHGLTDDSRAVAPRALFVAVRGHAADGHAYLGAAAERGAAAALVETAGATTLPALVVRDGRRAAALVAAIAYDEPAQHLTLAGVTGTNGKTTTVGMLRHLLDDAERPSASIGTLGVLLGSAGDELPGGAGLTTPGPIELQRVLRALVDRGVRSVAMEVSSHSLDQRRVEGLHFDAAVFTNLTRDHLDYHGTMEAYFAAKAKLLDHLGPQGAAILNADDPAWSRLPRATRTVTFSTAGAEADVQMRDVTFDGAGSRATLLALGESARIR